MHDHSTASEEQAASGWMVRLLTGLQQGAEAPLLESVEYLVGQDESCDLVLWDATVAPCHLALWAAGGRLRVRALEQPLVLLDAILAPHETLDLVAAAILRVGAVVLAVGAVDTDWSRLALPAMPDDSPRTPAATPESVPDPEPDTEAAAVPIPPTHAPDTEPPAVAVRSWKRPRPVVVTLVGAGIVPLAILLLFGLAFDARRVPEAVPSPETIQAQALERARALAQEMEFDEIEMRLGADGVLTLHGYSETRARRDTLTDALLAEGLRVDNRLWPEDVLHATLRETLERLGGRHLSYDYLGRGEIQVRGVLHPELAAERLVRTLRDDVPGVRRVVTELQPLAPFLADLREGLRAARLDRKLTILSVEPPVTLSGRLDPGEMTHWSALRDRLTARYPDLPPLASDVVLDEPRARPATMGARSPIASAANSPIPGSPVRVVGILIGVDRDAYAILDTGERVTRGDRIGGHYVVEEIRFDQVVALADGQRRIFRVGVSD